MAVFPLCSSYWSFVVCALAFGFFVGTCTFLFDFSLCSLCFFILVVVTVVHNVVLFFVCALAIWILYWSVFSLFSHPRCDNCLCCSHWCYLCCSRLWFLCWYMHLSSFVIHVAILFLSVCLFVVVYQPWNHLFHSCLHLPDIYCARRFAGVTPFHIWSSLRIIDFQLLLPFIF